jgi:hypothetical protein
MMIVTTYTDRVWFIPQKFWSATKGMSPQETEKLVEDGASLSAVRDFEALKKFDFIVVGKPPLGPSIERPIRRAS